MTMFIIQSLLLMAIAYILGCIIGCILHRLFTAPEKAAVVAAPIAAAKTHQRYWPSKRSTFE